MVECILLDGTAMVNETERGFCIVADNLDCLCKNGKVYEGTYDYHVEHKHSPLTFVPHPNTKLEDFWFSSEKKAAHFYATWIHAQKNYTQCKENTV